MSGSGKIKTSGRMPEDWAMVLDEALKSSHMTELKAFLKSRIADNAVIYPQPHEYFLPFKMTLLANVRAVIVGQEPYCAQGQAHGIGFSVPQSTRIPPALYNIHKELRDDLNISLPQHGCLESWAKEGVLLLNSTFTVEHDKPGSHKGKGWEEFTIDVLSIIAKQNSGCSFMAWGKEASSILRKASIDTEKHLCLFTSHPAPYSATKGFLGCRHFSKTNAFMRQKKLTEINWKLT